MSHKTKHTVNTKQDPRGPTWAVAFFVSDGKSGLKAGRWTLDQDGCLFARHEDHINEDHINEDEV